MSPIQILSNKRNFIIAFFSITYMLTTIHKAQAKMSESIISCSISVKSPLLLSNEILLDFTITNLSNKEISLLTWYSPLEGFLSNLFRITKLKNGELLEYQGPMVKRGQPTQIDYITLAAKESITSQINLAQAYPLTKGHFSLQVNRTKMQLRLQSQQLTNINCSPEITTFEIQ